jgi:DNA-binding beta-propeller fold protein YncE
MGEVANYRDNHSLLRLLLSVFIIFLLNRCAGISPLPEKQELTGQLSLFFQVEPRAQPISFQLLGIEIQRENLEFVPLPHIAQQIDAATLQGREIFLWEGWLPQGTYKGLRFLLGEAYLKKRKKKQTLKTPSKVYLPIFFSLQKDRNTTVIITWDPATSLQKKAFFAPQLKAALGRVWAPDLRLLFVSNRGGDNVRVIDRAKGKVLGTVLVGNRPQGLVISPDRRYVYLLNSGAGSISVMDLRTGEIIKEIYLKLAAGPVKATISLDGKELYVINKISRSLSIISLQAGTEEKNILIGEDPVNLILSPDGHSLYIACRGSNNVYLINLQRSEILSVISAGSAPTGLALDIRRERLFVSNGMTGTVTIINTRTNTIEMSFQVGGEPGEIAYDSMSQRLYIIDNRTNNVLITNSQLGVVISRLKGSDSLQDIEIDSSLREIYLLTKGGYLEIFDLASQRKVRSVPVGREPFEMAFIESNR